MMCGEENATCNSGAQVAETISYIVLTLEASEAKSKMPLVHLAISQEGEHTLPRSSFRILGNEQGKPILLQKGALTYKLATFQTK